jgi:hypothetical protein
MKFVQVAEKKKKSKEVGGINSKYFWRKKGGIKICIMVYRDKKA